MIRTLYTSKSGMHANQSKLDAISNNLANSNTMGYKKVNIGFKDLLNESLDKKGTPLNNKEASMGTGVKTSNIYRDNGQGQLIETLRSSDIAIDGVGYFKVIGEDGNIAYTRDGAFSVDGKGRLVDSRGNKLFISYMEGRNENNVKFTKDNFLVDNEGSVFFKTGENFQKVGNINVYTAVGDDAFHSIGENLFLLKDGVNVELSKDFSLYQGAMEGSNVDIGEEFTELIITQRAFQLSSKSLTTADEMWGMINSIRR